MAPMLLKQQVNSDYRKETLFNKETSFGKDTMSGIAQLIRKGAIDITNMDAMAAAEIRTVSRQLKLKSLSKKSNVRLLEEIKAVTKMYVAGQGNIKQTPSV